MLLIVSPSESIVDIDGDITIFNEGYYGSMDFLEDYSEKEFDLILDGRYITDDEGVIKYFPVKKGLFTYKGKQSMIDIRRELIGQQDDTRYSYDVLSHNVKGKLVQSYVLYPQEAINNIMRIVESNKKMIIRSMNSIAHHLINADKSKVESNQVIIYKNGDMYKVLYSIKKQLVMIDEYPASHYEEETITEATINKLRNVKYKAWEDIDIQNIDSTFVETIKDSVYARGGGIGEIYSFFKFFSGLEKISK